MAKKLTLFGGGSFNSEQRARRAGLVRKRLEGAWTSLVRASGEISRSTRGQGGRQDGPRCSKSCTPASPSKTFSVSIPLNVGIVGPESSKTNEPKKIKALGTGRGAKWEKLEN